MSSNVSTITRSAAFASLLIPTLFASLPTHSAVVTTGYVSSLGGIGPGDTVTSGVLVGGNVSLPGTGSVTVDDGSQFTIVNPFPYLNVAPLSGSVGSVTVTDPGSLMRFEGANSSEGGAFLTIGRNGTGVFDILNAGRVEIDSLGDPLITQPGAGGTFPAGFQIGRNAGSTGTLNISGDGSELSVVSDFAIAFIGRSGNATANVTNGGKLSFSGKNSDLNVASNLGQGATAVLNVNTGGKVEGSVFMDVGNRPNGMGTVNLDGPNSSISLTGACTADCPAKFSNPNQGAFLTVGAGAGTGVFNITNGAKLTIDLSGTPNAQFSGFILGSNSFLGAEGDGTLTVDGSGSQLTVIGDKSFFGVGRLENSKGELNILNGGQVIVQNDDGQSAGFVGDRIGAEGNINIDGNTSLLDAGNFLRVGVNDTNPEAPGGKGTVTLSNDGTLKVDNLFISSGGTLQGNGTVMGSTGPVVTTIDVNGTLSPGASTGTLEFVGDLILEAGTTLIEANSSTDFDEIIVSGDLIIRGGVLEVLLGYTPDPDEILEFLFSDNILFEQGGFEAINVFAMLGSNVAAGTAVSIRIGDAIFEEFVSEVPLPGGLVLLLSALGLLGFRRFSLKLGPRRSGLVAGAHT